MDTTAVTPDHLLEQINLVAQIASSIIQVVLLGVAVWAGIAAYRQLGSFKLFELLKFTQDETFRAARRCVIQEIGPKATTDWWTDKQLEVQASTCCGSYDVLAKTLQFEAPTRVTKFFTEHWAASIVRTYSILEPFIMQRRNAGGLDYSGYEWLYRKALHYRQPPPANRAIP